MLNRLLPTGVDETKYKRLTSIRQLARVFRNHQLTYPEVVLAADELMDMITARDAQIAAMEQEISRLNTVMSNFQREIKEMRAIMEKFEIRPPSEGRNGQ